MRITRIIGSLAVLMLSVMSTQAALADDRRSRSSFDRDEMSAASAPSGPTTPLVKIVQVRPYVSQGADPGTALIQVDQKTACNGAVYAIHMVSGGSKEAYATALVAMVTDKQVAIELADCSGATPTIRSITLSQ